MTNMHEKRELSDFMKREQSFDFLVVVAVFMFIFAALFLVTFANPPAERIQGVVIDLSEFDPDEPIDFTVKWDGGQVER